MVPCFQWTHCEIVLYRSSLLASLGNPALFCVCVRESRLSHVQLFVTPWSLASQVPVSMEVSRQEYWSRLPSPSPGDLPDPRMDPGSPTLQADSLPSEPPGKPTGVVRSKRKSEVGVATYTQAAAATKSLQSCLTPCKPIDGSPLGSPVPGILQARTLEWVAISFFNA